MGTSYNVQWDGVQLEYAVFGNGFKPRKKISISADDAKWKRFWETLDLINAWGWKKDYTQKGVLDGTSWGVEIVYAGRELKSGGCNAYPPKFDEFLKAVQELLGGKEFA